MCINYFLVFELNKNDGNSKIVDIHYRDLIYVFYGSTWIWSMYVQFYEYKRGLPHAWYCHQLFWTLSFLSYGSMVCIYLTNKDQMFTDFYSHASMIQIYVCFSALAFVTFFLSILGFLVKKEYKFNENRNIF